MIGFISAILSIGPILGRIGGVFSVAHGIFWKRDQVKDRAAICCCCCCCCVVVLNSCFSAIAILLRTATETAERSAQILGTGGIPTSLTSLF